MTSIAERPDRDHLGEAPVALYIIRVRGCLEGAGWSDWFGPMQVSIDLGHGETTLRGPVADQAELYGLLSKLRSLALPLLLVQRVDDVNQRTAVEAAHE